MVINLHFVVMMKSALQTCRPLLLTVLLLTLLGVWPALAETPGTSSPKGGGILGTVTDSEDGLLVGATVVVEGASASERRTVLTDENGFFEFRDLQAKTPYRVIVTAVGFTEWRSGTITLAPGQFLMLTGSKLRIEGAKNAITVTYNQEEIATEQVRAEETQRVFGIIPNFYVVYDHDAVPLTARLKFRLAAKVATDPVTIAGVGTMAAIYQASDHLNYTQGAKGYGQRFGAIATDGFTDIMIGGAILPSVLHQDPRYFYQGNGSGKSRLMHALSNAFVCKGDNGHLQPNYSTIVGDLASSAISMTYFPESNRSASTFFGGFALGTAERMLSSVMQEFVLGKFTHKSPDLH